MWRTWSTHTFAWRSTPNVMDPGSIIGRLRPLHIGRVGCRLVAAATAASTNARIGSQHVEQELVAVFERWPGVAHDPLGMTLEALAARVDHLGFDPDAESEPRVDGRLRDGSHAAGQLVGIDRPVAQERRRHCGVRRTEPAVVSRKVSAPIAAR
jgi:hypothetical protein